MIATPPTIAEVIAAKKAKAAPVTEKDAGKPGTTQAAVSLFKRVNLPTPCGVVSIRDFVKQVQDGTHAAAVAKVRQELARVQASDLTPEQRKQAVNKVKLDLLPTVSLSGCVTSGGRAKAMDEGRFRHSGWLQIDLDAKDMNGASAATTRDLIGGSPHILTAALSPTGEGVKGIMRVPVCKTPGEHLAAFLAAESYMLATYGLKIDPATKNPARDCYITHDPQATWNGATVPLPVPEPQELPQQPAAVAKAPRQGLIIRETGGHREITAEDVRAMLAAIPPRPEYSQWLRIASAVWDATDEATGTALLNAWSPEESPGEYAEKFSHRLTEVHAGTLVMLAKENGWQPARRDWKSPERIEGGTGSKPLSAFLVDHSDTIGMSWEEIDALRPPYVIDGFIRWGEVMLLGAESKSRKSWLAQDAGIAVAAGLPWLADENGENGFTVARARVHVFDLELNPSEMRFRFAKARGNRFADSHEDASAITGRFAAYSFDGLNVMDIMPRLDELKATVNPGDLVIVDCLYRLVPDGNETAEVANILETVKRFAAETQSAVIVVDHFRKAGDDKARNRFAGSFVKQASASTLVAIESKPDDVLVLNIDARTFHGCPVVHARFNLETYTFNRIPEAEVQAARDASSAAEAIGWLVAVWKTRPLAFAASVADGMEKWSITRQGATPRFAKLESRNFVALAENKPGHAKKWTLTDKGREAIKSALGLHPSLHL